MESLSVTKNQKLVKFILENVENVSFSTVMKLLRKKDVKVNGKRVKEDVNLNVGDSVVIYYEGNGEKPFCVLFFDTNVLIIEKKSGYTSESVFNALQKEYGEIYFIHRLDRNTSGIMVFAKNKTAEKELLKGFKTHSFEKYYLARVVGKMPKKSDILTAYLVKDSGKGKVTVFSKKVVNSIEIKTGYEVISEDKETSLLKVRLYTGKTHQIRAHLSFIGNPIVGDGKYGDYAFNKKAKEKSQNLLSNEIVFHFEKDDTLYYLDGKSFKVK